MSEKSIVHPWTLRWWETLPNVYKTADAHQFTLEGAYQVGLNADPTFKTSNDGWIITPATQTSTTIAARIEQTFTSLTPGKMLYTQVWWTTPAPGTSLTISIFGQSPTPLAQTILTSFETGSGQEVVTVPAGIDGTLTVRVDISGPVTTTNAPLITLQAINVGTRTVQYEALPGIITTPSYPLLRFMDGPGRVAGLMRDISDQAWAGDLTDPQRAPDGAIRWLAQMLGLPVAQRTVPLDKLRTTLQSLVTDGRPGVGTRQAILTAAKPFLIGDGQATILPPSPNTPPHTIVMLVRSDQVPGENLTTLVANIRATGAIPAGHNLVARLAISEWNAWEQAAGTTWADVEQNTKTWAVADSLGIQLDPIIDP